MTIQTGENEQAMRKILDMTRLISIIILVIHFYYYSYVAFQEWGLSNQLSDRLLGNICSTGLFGSFHKSKFIALGFLLISLLGARGRKDNKLNYKTAFANIITGLLIYFTSYLTLLLKIKTSELATTVIHEITAVINLKAALNR
ncbi:mobilization protein BF0133 [Aquipluma nitroreducens]|uniref:Mobilization protein BF0133 n=1 Tax=Aquipluma nitroreducens TaxID=2010828 RepID=A0A5K7S3Y5_9BACT|nr:YWFCY domain-containing protein [Aquipluma nitroreducens]BBE16054.1 mobilization protein BF0133 [Aquipluma nitroreducens]